MGERRRMATEIRDDFSSNSEFNNGRVSLVCNPENLTLEDEPMS